MISKKNLVFAAAGLVLVLLIGRWQCGGESDEGAASSGESTSGEGGDLAPPSLDGEPGLANRIRAALAKRRGGAAGPVDLAGAWRVEGAVVDGSGGRVPGVDVLFRGPRGEATATSDGSGEFEIELAAGTYRVHAIGAQLISRAAPSLRVIPSDEPQRIEVAVERLATISGKVVDHNGFGVGGAEVHFIAGNPAERAMTRAGLLLDRAITESDGGFAIDVLAKKQLVLEARSGHLRARAVVENVKAGSDRGGVTIALSEAIEVSGTVANPRGRMVSGAEVRLTVSGSGLEHSQEVETDSAGRFVFAPMTRGGFTLEARAEGYGPAYPVSVPADKVGRGELSYDLSLQPGTAVAGVVVDGEGRPLTGVRIRLGRGGSSFKALERYTDTDGSFEIPNVDRAKHWLSAVKGGYATTTVEGLEPPKRDLEITLLPFGAIRGRVRDARGQPLSSFVVRLDTVKQRGVFRPKTLNEATRFSDGSYELPELEPGRYQMTVSASGYQSSALSIEVPPGETADGSAMLAPIDRK